MRSSSWDGPPPPARGELREELLIVAGDRTTPACAGRTHARPSQCRPGTDHPRLRGENETTGLGIFGRDGPPPPARGELPHVVAEPRRVRTTPACAGRTGRPPSRRPSRAGPPPPARGEHGSNPKNEGDPRTTPACAGRTSCWGGRTAPCTDHPRLRGENGRRPGSASCGSGPPPPARGELHRPGRSPRAVRTTPACAGRTPSDRPPAPAKPDHPRLRGENCGCPYWGGAACGPPPPARGERSRGLSRRPRGRTTPACAGRTLG